jgi:riboflavin synthase
MFTGLVEAIGKVAEVTPVGGGFRLRILTALAAELAPGDSVAVNGVCLTVIVSAGGEIAAEIGPETTRITTLGRLSQGGHVNLERPLRADGRLGGHFVQGHVDGIGQVEDTRADVDFHWLTVSFPPELAQFIVRKGSIAVDGVSLTVAGLGPDRFTIQVVPYTMTLTTLGRLHVRERVNLECDMVGKYVVRAAEVAGLILTSAKT